jgi:1,4-alpha-glucan branching enzyme
MPGDRWQKFANLRAYYGFMFTHPGKKLMFMGGEFAQDREWSHDRSLDWHLLADPLNEGVSRLIRDLNRLYRDIDALHSCDCGPAGFEWIDTTDWQQSVISYLRRGSAPDDFAVIVCNFTPLVRERYRVGVPSDGLYLERLNTDSAYYGGSDIGNAGVIASEAFGWNGRPNSLLLTLPPLSTLVLTPHREGASL